MNLKRNKIRTLHFGDDTKLETNHKNPNPATIELSKNPIHCDCHAYKLLSIYRQLNGFESDKFRLRFRHLRCAGPPSHANRDVSSLHLDQLFCGVGKSYSCPEKCSCTIVPHNVTVKVDCSARNLTAVPRIPAFVPFQLEGTSREWNFEVHLERNLLEFYPNEEGNTCDDFGHVYLDGNRLKKVGCVPRNVKVFTNGHYHSFT